MRPWIPLAAASAVVASVVVSPDRVAASDLWIDVESAPLVAHGERQAVPSTHRMLRLDLLALNHLLATAPLAGHDSGAAHPTLLEIPLPDGSFARFQVEEAPIMAPELAARYPQIKTYRGQGVDDPVATLRFDLTPQGFHARILTASESFWVDPWQLGDREHYVAYRERDAALEEPGEFFCGATADPDPGEHLAGLPEPERLGGGPSNGGTLRNYRIAVASTGEFTAAASVGEPTVEEGLAAIVTIMNRINLIFERSMSLTMTLVANNDQIVYTNGATDPYPNGDVVGMMFENETNLNAVIGFANFDIGHVLGTGGGGVAFLRVPCTSIKARGASAGSPGEVFAVRVVAHEIGHQFGAHHTFNGNAGSCGSANQRNPGTAYGPGSGSTIQSYAGLCSDQNLQSISDSYYHSISLEEMSNYTVNGNGNSCPSRSDTGNGIPTVDAGSGYTIPIDTPFELCGSSSDPDGHPLTFVWEQFNLGPAGHPDSPVNNAPIFRSWPPTESSCRTFPRLEDLLVGTTVIGELLPTYARTLTFRLTARDNQATGGAFASDSVDLVVTDQAGPFWVTATGGEIWMAGQTETVNWDVAGTQLAPVSCAAVDLLLSTDGGFTYPHLLADDVNNDGEQSVVVPDATTSQARVKVVCSDNIFFDVSDQDFEVIDGGTIFADGFESGDTSAWS